MESERETLIKEIKKWTKKINEEIKGIQGDEDFLKNINAYINDSKYFFEKNDFVRSFEAIIWAWAWLEIGKDIKKVYKN